MAVHQPAFSGIIKAQNFKKVIQHQYVFVTLAKYHVSENLLTKYFHQSVWQRDACYDDIATI